MAEPLDKTDEQIVALLVSDARRSVSDIARLLGIGRATAHERIARLEKNGTIAGYTVILNRNPFEQTTQALVMLSIVQRRQKEIVRALQSLPEVVLCYSVSGDSDLIVNVQAPRIEDVDALLDEILGIDGVERCRSWIILGQQFRRSLSA
jgi:DNA-binding Lrp family transcriptional regulator